MRLVIFGVFHDLSHPLRFLAMRQAVTKVTRVTRGQVSKKIHQGIYCTVCIHSRMEIDCQNINDEEKSNCKLALTYRVKLKLL